jgi:hypothetical protein
MEIEEGTFVFSFICFLSSVVFFILKLVKVISWSWIWIFVPIWGPLGVAFAVVIIITLFSWFEGLFSALVEYIFSRF